MFDISQTSGEPLPELDKAATGDGEEIFSALLEAAEALELEIRVVEEEDWPHDPAKVVCKHRSSMSMRPIVEVKARSNDADLATTLIHEYAHAQLHLDVDHSEERAKRHVTQPGRLRSSRVLFGRPFCPD